MLAVIAFAMELGEADNGGESWMVRRRVRGQRVPSWPGGRHDAPIFATRGSGSARGGCHGAAALTRHRCGDAAAFQGWTCGQLSQGGSTVVRPSWLWLSAVIAGDEQEGRKKKRKAPVAV